VILGGNIKRMKVTRQDVATKLCAYLGHEFLLADLVDWAERAIYESDFDDDHFDAIRDAVAKLGLADVKAFGLTLEDCEALLKRLGYSMRVDVVSV